MATNTKNTNRKKSNPGIKEFRGKVTSLVDRGYQYIGMARVSEIPSVSSSEMMKGGGAIGGLPIQGTFDIFDSRQSNPVPVSNAGTPGLGYIPWGPGNMLPNTIYKLVGSLPYTATAIKYIIDLTVGLGPQLMYRWSRYVNGTVKTELIPFKDAGLLIRNRIMEIQAQIDQQKAESGEEQGGGGTITWSQAVSGEEQKDTAQVGTPEYELKQLREDYHTWEETDKEWDKFCENNNLELHYLKCMTDDAHMDIYFPTIGLSIGRKDEEWDPKIVKLGNIPAVCCRMEEMDERMRINYVYYAEKWRKDATPKLERKDVVAYPTLMPENMLTELRRQVEKSKNRPPKKRTTWFCCPSYYPSMLKPYYPQPAWWSIFPSMTYDYATTLITDKAMARQNATMWGKMIFINNEYLRAMFDEMGADTTEAKQAVRDSIYKKVNEFLQRRENNGKTICLDSFVGPDGKTMQHAVEIVDVPQLTNSTELKDELEEISSIIFFAYGVHPALIGAVPGKSGSSGGTYQRELQLLKQNQLSTRQRIYLRFMKNIYTFNKWDKHGEIVIRQQTFTTLDRSATGTEETESTL